MDFIILKVNGRDLSQATHEEAVQAFLTAQEPISIEVLRRSRSTISETGTSLPAPDQPSSHHQNGATESNKSSELAVQTDTGSCICPRCGYSPSSATSVDQDEDEIASTRTSTGVRRNTFVDQVGPEDDGLADEVEFKITITRSSSQGVVDVICRNLASIDQGHFHPCVIVDQINDKQILNEGILQEGDRILQINGKTIQDADHAARFFHDLNQRELVVLVTRPQHYDMDDGDSVEELRMSLLEGFHDAGDEDADEDGLDEGVNCHEKDSGLADSCKNDDSSENDLLSPRSSKYNTTSSGSGGCCDMDAYEHLHVREASMQTDLDGPSREVRRPRDSILSIENELLAVSLQMEKIHMQCQAIQEPLPSGASPRPPKPPRAPRSSSLPTSSQTPPYVLPSTESSSQRRKQRRHSDSKHHLNEKPKVPCRPGVVKMSSPEFFEFPAAPQGQPGPVKGHRYENGRTSGVTLLTGVAVHIPYGPVDGAPVRSGRHERGSVPQPMPRQHSRTNPNQLRTVREDEELGPVRQHIYEQIKSNDDGFDGCGSLQRSSGAKSASKRPVRDKLLQERAFRITQERSGITTDDDAMSELKTGKYWTKDEKRQQLLTANEMKRQREIEKVRLQLTLTETPNIIALSQKKFLKKNGRNMDDFGFTTVGEILANRNRSSVDHKTKINGLANVTTV